MNYILTIVLALTPMLNNKVYGQLLLGGGHKDIPIGAYNDEYKELDINSLDSIKKVLYTTLNNTSIDSILVNEQDMDKIYPKAWHILMRTAKIDWKNKKNEVIDLLHDFSLRILSGKSYLTLPVFDDYQNRLRSKSNPAFFPFYAYWVMLRIDSDYSSKYIDEIFSSDNMVLGSVNYQQKFKTNLLIFLQDHYKSDKILLSLNKNRLKWVPQDSLLLVDIRKKHEAYILKDQSLTWDYLLSNYKISPISKESMYIWYRNLIFFSEIYPNADTNILFTKIKNSKNYEETYYLSYSLCGLINRELLSLNKTQNTKVNATNAIILVDEYYENYGSKLNFVDGTDLLKSCYESLKLELSKNN